MKPIVEDEIIKILVNLTRTRAQDMTVLEI